MYNYHVEVCILDTLTTRHVDYVRISDIAFPLIAVLGSKFIQTSLDLTTNLSILSVVD